MEQSNFSLKRICQARLKGAFIQIRQAHPQIQNYLLIVDERTLKVISAYMKMAELMELGISAIEKLELGRKPFPKLNAIYFISPTQYSVQKVIDDFANKKQPQYGAVHFIISNEIDQSLMQKIALSENLITKVMTFKILNLDFSCSSNQVFNLDQPSCLLQVFSDKPETQAILKETANKLATLLISFDKFYSFELLYNQNDNKISEQVARFTQIRLYDLFTSFQKTKNEQYDNIEKTAGKITVFILDRSFDPLSPLLHDFFYQPMIYDLLDINNDVFEMEQDVQGQQIVKKVILSETDDLFNRYRYKHIAEVLEGIPLEFKEFVNNNTTAKVQQGQIQNMDLKQMSDIVRTMPQYNELLSKYTTHMKIIEKSWGIFENKELRDVGDLEQSLATGIDRDGKNINSIKVLSQVGTKLLNNNLDQYDKLRLMLLTTICLEMTDQDRKSLTDKISFENQKAILNLQYLGVKGGSKKGKTTNIISEQMKKQAKNKMATATMDLCRTTPLLESLIETYVETGKKPAKFDSIKINEDGMESNKKGGGSIRKVGGQLAKMMQTEENDESLNEQKKLIIFVVGGIGYNEIRALLNNQKIAQSQIVVFLLFQQYFKVIGSTQIMKPKDYCLSLLNLKRND